MTFANRWVLWLLLTIPLLAAWQLWRRKRPQATLTVSSDEAFLQKTGNWRVRTRTFPFYLRLLTLCFGILALARPQSSMWHKNVDVEGIDIALALDVSGSMMAMDFRPNRLEACKSVIKEFIGNRPNDRIGLVVYSAEAYTRCPLTTDHQTLLDALSSTRFGIIDDGTAIGDGLGTAINRLRESKAKSKVIILLSDGVNNAGYMDPLSAAEIAKNQGIRVYTIGCGSNGEALVSIPNVGSGYIRAEIDEQLLRGIAQETGGRYFRAQNKNRLKEVYREIDQMEKTRIHETVFTNRSEEFLPFLCIALLCFLLEMFWTHILLRIKP
ncbi:MAG: VWA domain-containing protein [Bacteroidales bacterium]|nr:VWA domain-containing protein [Bacteroidales bacterium]